MATVFDSPPRAVKFSKNFVAARVVSYALIPLTFLPFLLFGLPSLLADIHLAVNGIVKTAHVNSLRPNSPGGRSGWLFVKVEGDPASKPRAVPVSSKDLGKYRVGETAKVITDPADPTNLSVERVTLEDAVRKSIVWLIPPLIAAPFLVAHILGGNRAARKQLVALRDWPHAVAVATEVQVSAAKTRVILQIAGATPERRQTSIDGRGTVIDSKIDCSVGDRFDVIYDPATGASGVYIVSTIGAASLDK